MLFMTCLQLTMRKTNRPNFIRRYSVQITVILVVVVGAGLLGYRNLTPAYATGPLCYSFDHQHCAGTVNFSLGAPVGTATVGRTIQWVASENVLKFTGDDNRCLRSTDDRYIVVGTCFGQNGIKWTRLDKNGNHIYRNNRVTFLQGHSYVLGSTDHLGDKMRAVDENNSPGWEKQWDGP